MIHVGDRDFQFDVFHEFSKDCMLERSVSSLRVCLVYRVLVVKNYSIIVVRGSNEA